MDKQQILFVDDEPRILDGLRRMLRSMRREWDMHFVGGGQEALDFLVDNRCEVIVSDMRMPGIDGAKLLEAVKTNYPHVVRIALSGQTSKETILDSVGPIHQYLPKPCDAETLKSTISRVCSLRSLLVNESLQGAISQLESLPCLSTLYTELMDELKSSNASIDRVGEIVAKDISITAKILQLVNSAFFGVRQHVSDVQQAVSLLGLETVSVLVLSVSIFSQFEDEIASGFSCSELWDHSLEVGRFAGAIAKHEKASPEEAAHAMIAGTLHDIGKVVMITKTPDDYRAVLDLVIKDGATAYDAEQQVYKVSHAEVGGYLLGLWGFDESVIQSIVFHQNPIASNSEKFSVLTAVHAANVISNELHAGVMGGSSKLDESYLQTLGLAGRIDHWRKLCLEETAVSC